VHLFILLPMRQAMSLVIASLWMAGSVRGRTSQAPGQFEEDIFL